MNVVDQVESSFRPLLAKPCWNAKRGVGSFLTFEFGDPSLRVREPIGKLTSRLVIPVGTWHLWIHSCDWRIHNGGELIAHSESIDSDISRAIAFLDGQAVSQIPEFDATAGQWMFWFDLGGVLTTKPYDAQVSDDQWLLFEPDSHVLVADGFGNLTRRKGNSV